MVADDGRWCLPKDLLKLDVSSLLCDVQILSGVIVISTITYKHFPFNSVIENVDALSSHLSAIARYHNKTNVCGLEPSILTVFSYTFIADGCPHEYRCTIVGVRIMLQTPQLQFSLQMYMLCSPTYLATIHVLITGYLSSCGLAPLILIVFTCPYQVNAHTSVDIQ